jgi:glycosyltransferase 2 family protein
LQRRPEVSTGMAIASSVIDRLFDAVSLCILIGVGLHMAASAWGLERVFGVTSALLVLIGGMIALLVFGGDRWSGFKQYLPRGGALGRRVLTLYEEAVSQLQFLRKPGILLSLVALQVIISALDILSCWILFVVFGWSLPPTAALLVLVCIATAASLPSTPGYIGVYQVAAMAALYRFDIASSQALAYGTILQVCNFALFVTVGLWAYLQTRIDDRKYRQRLYAGDENGVRSEKNGNET